MNAFVARQTLDSFRKSMTQISSPEQTVSLSDREKEVLECMCEGMTYKEIATKLNIAIDTVRSHTRKIYEKLQVRSKTEAVLFAIRKKLI
jgi:RNA polymerase sigma factor (sigma-70 family)